MFSSDQYEMLDFGEGRRLERFGELILDRPCPAAGQVRYRAESLWKNADAYFLEQEPEKRLGLGHRGKWLAKTERGRKFFSNGLDGLTESEHSNRETWSIRHDDPSFQLELKGSPFGHLGVFPEQSDNWRDIYHFCQTLQKQSGDSVRILNLFAYTGGSTLAAAAAGVEVTHLDAAGNIVQQARRNAELSFGPDKTVRWIVDDAVKFVRRELKRGNHYNGIILDPPTYGHGARGEVWRFSRDFPKLLSDSLSLIPEGPGFLLLTCHVTGLEPSRLLTLVNTEIHKTLASRESRIKIEMTPMTIRSRQNANLPAGQRVLVSIPK